MSADAALAGSTALVTGASRGIGLAVARVLAAAGARVVITSRSAGTLEALAGTLAGGAICLPADLTARTAAVELAQATMKALGGAPSIVVHAAGNFPMAVVEDADDASVEEAFALNAAAPLRLTRELLPAMRARGSGHVVMIGSISDRVIFPGNAVYAASKHALRAVHETLRAETRGSGLRATLISPAATDTPIWDPYAPDSTPTLPNRSEMLRAEDVADAVLWAVTRPPHVDIEELRLAHS